MSVTRWIHGQEMERDQVLGLFDAAQEGRRSVSEGEGRNETGNEFDHRFPLDDVAEVMGNPLDHILSTLRETLAASRLVATSHDRILPYGRSRRAVTRARSALAEQPPALPAVRSAALPTGGWTSDAVTEFEIPLADPDLVDGLKMTAEPVRLWALAALGDLPGARERAEAIVAAADRHDDPALIAAETILSLGAWDEGRLAAGLDLMRDAVHRASRGFAPSSHSELGRSHLSLRLAKMLADVGRFDEANAVVRSAGEIEPSRRSVQAATSAVLRAQIELAAGRLDAAATAAGLATADQLGPHPLAPGALCVLATVALRRGDLRAAAQHVKSYRALLAANPVTFGSAHFAWVEAQLADAQDGPVGAFEVMTSIYDCLPARRGLLVGDPALAAWMVRTALAVGDRKRAEGVVAGAEQLAAANPEFPTIAAAAEHARGLLHGNAATLVQAAEQHRHLWARASAAEDAGVLLAARGDGDSAIASFDQAMAAYWQAGADRDVARVRSRLRRLGERRSHWRRAARPFFGWASLTDTERSVANLVAEGLTNRQVGERMFLSHHTVDFHLRQVYRKLDITSRVDLTRLVLEQKYEEGLKAERAHSR
jgi:DNA-binding CsgD family transcriptional regulator